MAPWMSVVIPAYNEEMTVAGTVSAARAWLDERGVTYEIVVVDNASTDRTVEVLEPLLDGPRVRLLRNEVNGGKGYSVRRGMLDCSGELRLMCDADCLPSLVSLDDMVALIEGADVVIGSRNIDGSRVDRTQPLRRRIASWNFLNLCRLTMNEPSRDIFCGFKLWRAEAAEAAFSRQSIDGLGLRHRGARSRPPARIHGARDGHRVERPRGLAAVHDARADTGDPRAAGRAAQRAPRRRAAGRALLARPRRGG